MAAYIKAALLTAASLQAVTAAGDVPRGHFPEPSLNLRGGGTVGNTTGPEAQARELLFGAFGTAEARHASVWLRYQKPSNTPIMTWYATLTPKHSSERTYFSVLGNNFGYFGMQQVEKGDWGIFKWFQGKIVFSIWDAHCGNVMDENACPEAQRAQVIECGPLSICGRFGGEGTGAKSRMNFHEWRVEQDYGFLIAAFQESTTHIRYEGYFWAGELAGWILMSKLSAPVGHRSHWSLDGLYSFVEQWEALSGEDDRFCRIGPMFVENEGRPDVWTQVTSATFTLAASGNEMTTHVHGNVTGTYGHQWGFGIGGSLQRNIQDGAQLTVAGGVSQPSCLVQWRQMRQNNALPTGCLGGTCTLTAITQFFLSAFTLKYAPITFVICLILLGVCIYSGCFAHGKYKQHQARKAGYQNPGRPGAGYGQYAPQPGGMRGMPPGGRPMGPPPGRR